ncbi:MAG: TetR/AcrR family transcriptional regulator [Alphaproteobacteria bacterium]|nr:TetR/AcrR family transcriptional regulator [Alphaproteobacteria bacterium]
MKNAILEKASDLFFSKGYKATSLQELAEGMGIKAASLYYYFPGGKEEIYIEVLKTRLTKYKEQIQKLADEHQSLEIFFKQYAHWFINQPVMNMSLISQMDMPHLTPYGSGIVMNTVRDSIFSPLQNVVRTHSVLIKDIDAMRIVGIYLTLLNGMSMSLKEGYVKPDKLVDEFMEVLLRGLLK